MQDTTTDAMARAQLSIVIDGEEVFRLEQRVCTTLLKHPGIALRVAIDNLLEEARLAASVSSREQVEAVTQRLARRRGARPIITLANGVEIDLLRPDPGAVRPEVIATGLSNLCRYGGQLPDGVIEPVFYSVAEHSVLAARCAPPALALAALLHDASEAFGLVDVPAPLKRLLPEYRRIEAGWQAAVAERFGLVPDVLDDPALHEIDRRLGAAEQETLRGLEPEVEPLQQVHFACYEPVAARDAWLGAFDTLVGGASGVDIITPRHGAAAWLRIVGLDGNPVGYVMQADTRTRRCWVGAGPRSPDRPVPFERLEWRAAATPAWRRQILTRWPALAERFPALAQTA